MPNSVNGRFRRSSVGGLPLAALFSAVVVAAASCGGGGVTETGGALVDFGVADVPQGVSAEPAAPLSDGVVTPYAEAFNEVVPVDVDIIRITESVSPVSSLLWRRDAGALWFSNTATGFVSAWNPDGGVDVVRDDVFTPRPPAVDPEAEDDAPVADPDMLPEMFFGMDWDGNLFALDGARDRFLAISEQDFVPPRVTWTASAPDEWTGYGGLRSRPGDPGALWFTVAASPTGPGLYRFPSAAGEAAWSDPDLMLALPGARSFAFSADGRFLFIEQTEPQLSRWRRYPSGMLRGDAVTFQVEFAVADTAPYPPSTYSGVVVDLAGRSYVTGPQGLTVLSVDGDVLGEIRLPVPVRDLAWGQDGSWLYAATSHGIYTVPVSYSAAGLVPGVPRVSVHTDAGSFTVALDAARAPLSTVNFLRYAHGRFYEGTIFHRVVRDFVIQAGGYDALLSPFPIPRGPIPNEASNGLSHDRGSLAMARIAAADSATTQWFVNVVDNSERGLAPVEGDPSQAGYAVFGRVVDGLQTVDDISMRPVRTVRDHMYVPIEPVVIARVEVLP